MEIAADRPDQLADLESELVERHRHGDPAAFEAIYATYARGVYNLVLRTLGNREEAADLLQEIFLRVHRHLGSFRGRSSLKTWIYRIAINRCRSRLRRVQPSWVGLAEEGYDGATPLEDLRRDPEQRAMASETSRRVGRLLARVPSPYRETLYLREIEELSYKEIAEIMTVRVGTVRSRIARGREHLRELLEGERL